MLRFNEKNIGEFLNECDVWFTFRNTTDVWGLKNGFKHELDTIDGVRFCNVKKTVVYVAVDEAADGSAVIEKWKLKKCFNWETANG